MIEIRREEEKDYAEVFRVVSQAFGQEDEARLVEKLRSVEPHISLVAEKDGEIAGHIFFSPMTLEDEKTDFLGLAPMAVAPEFQNQGVGSKLITEALKICAEENFDAVFVLGHKNYYPRFGFETAKTRGFNSEYNVPDEHFMVLELKRDALKGKSGTVQYSPEFAGI